ncbi:hypothetical protein PG988_002990 [Apiospora saccharicola]
MNQQHPRTTPKVKKTERDQLRIQRTQHFPDEPARDGNRLVDLPLSTSDSGVAVREAKARMKLKTESMIKSLAR